MARPMSGAMLAAIAANELQPAIFVQAQFLSGTVYLWSGYGNIVWNAQTWVGIGDLGSISAIEEGANVQARGITLSISGFDATLLADVLGEIQLGLPVIVYLGLFSGGALIANPIVSWAGRMDQPTVDVTGQTASLSINCENRLVEMNQGRNFRWTDDQQQLTYPGDTAFSFAQGLQNAVIVWGSNPSSPNNI
jgi:hypothetical protein